MVDAALVVERINADLATISDWSLSNGLRLNSQKSQAMAIYRKLPNSLVISAVIINDIPYSAKLNNLGMVMNCGFTWEDQISNVIQEVYFSLSRLWCTASLLRLDGRRILVVALILPIFLYCDVLYPQFLLGNRRELNLPYNFVQDMSTEFPVLSTSLIIPGVSWGLHWTTITLLECVVFCGRR
jgi:hypothetical protein